MIFLLLRITFSPPFFDFFYTWQELLYYEHIMLRLDIIVDARCRDAFRLSIKIILAASNFFQHLF